MTKAAIGVDIGGTNLRFALVDEGGRVLARKRAKTGAHRGVEAVLSRIWLGITALLDKAKAGGRKVAGVGVGVPGIVSIPGGVVRFSPNLPGWLDVPLKARLEGLLSLPVMVENDANAYTMGEAWQGAGKGVKSLICITLGTGVGGGIILDGRLWRGVDGMAGEVGHMTVNPGGLPCGCGNRGCLERYSSATAIVEITSRALSKGKESALTGVMEKQGLTAEVVGNAALSGDRLALKVYMDAGKYLGIAIADLINLLNVERIVIGGGMAGAWDLFIGPLREEVRKRAFEIPRERCEIVPARLGDDAGILGAARLVFGERKA